MSGVAIVGTGMWAPRLAAAAARRVRQLLHDGALGRVVLAEANVWPDACALDGVTTLILGGERVSFEGGDMLAEELAEFGRCIRGEAEPETGPDEGIAALAAVRQALESHAEAVA